MHRMTIVAAAALLALGGCDRFGFGGGGADEDRASANVGGGNAAASAAAAAPAATPADAGVTTSRSFAGLTGTAGGADGKDPAAAAMPVGSPGGIEPAQLVGRWTDDGDCKHDFEFRADGTFGAHTGGEGTWALAGDVLTLSGGDVTVRLRLQFVGADAMMTVDEQGETGRATRC